MAIEATPIPVDSPVVTQQGDQLVYRMIVIGLLVALLGIVTGMIALLTFGKEIPAEISQLAMPIITGLMAILSPLSVRGKQ